MIIYERPQRGRNILAYQHISKKYKKKSFLTSERSYDKEGEQQA